MTTLIPFTWMSHQIHACKTTGVRLVATTDGLIDSRLVPAWKIFWFMRVDDSMVEAAGVSGMTVDFTKIDHRKRVRGVLFNLCPRPLCLKGYATSQMISPCAGVPSELLKGPLSEIQTLRDASRLLRTKPKPVSGCRMLTSALTNKVIWSPATFGINRSILPKWIVSMQDAHDQKPKDQLLLTGVQ